MIYLKFRRQILISRASENYQIFLSIYCSGLFRDNCATFYWKILQLLLSNKNNFNVAIQLLLLQLFSLKLLQLLLL